MSFRMIAFSFSGAARRGPEIDFVVLPPGTKPRSAMHPWSFSIVGGSSE
jgi:hypothetical protein